MNYSTLREASDKPILQNSIKTNKSIALVINNTINNKNNQLK